MNAGEFLAVDGVSKTYRQGESSVQALKNISFKMNQGETLAIVGPSGSGKTTLLSLLAGLDEVSEGKIELDGNAIDKMNEKELTQFRGNSIGIVFQQFHLMPFLTAKENVALPLDIGQHSDAALRAELEIEKVGLSHRLDHLPSQMSGGECQRIAIARALVTRPKILLADEPSGNLDVQTGEKIMDLLFDLAKKEKMTMVLVTHNPNHAKLCQRSIELG